MTSMSMNFNVNSEKPRFIFKPNPLAGSAYQIFENKVNRAEYEPVGSYIVLDQSEDKSLTEKKLVSLINVMNGRERIDLRDQVETRLLFQVVPKKLATDPTKVIFRTHDGKGVSVENAVLEIERGIFDA
jgi:hypothetical protein